MRPGFSPVGIEEEEEDEEDLVEVEEGLETEEDEVVDSEEEEAEDSTPQMVEDFGAEGAEEAPREGEEAEEAGVAEEALEQGRRGKEDALVTKNMVVGESVYGEKRISVEEGETKIEYRAWNPFRSKLAAAILGGVDQIHIKPGAKVMYLGAASGTTVSHVSDIVGPPDQTRIVALNAHNFLKNGGHFVISIKANCIDSTAAPEAVFASEVKKMSAENMKPQEQLTLEPYERDHAVVVGIYRPPPKQKK
ncbi:hypothetical protein INR49_002624 [Caranx melampygus]|nr:hypothetical protein INR49_002624 [Caranx melampygus]